MVQFFGAGEVKKGLVNGEWLNQRRELQHLLPHLPSHPDIFFHIRLDHNGFWAEFQCLEHGHGGTHTGDAGDIAAGGDNTALAAANNDRLVVQ